MKEKGTTGSNLRFWCETASNGTAPAYADALFPISSKKISGAGSASEERYFGT